MIQLPVLAPYAALQRFLTADSGAVTVDWVVLTAAVTGLGLGVVGSVRSGVTTLGGDLGTSLEQASVAALGCLGSPCGYSGPTTNGIWGASSTHDPMTGYTLNTTTYWMSDGDRWVRTVETMGDGTQTETWATFDGTPITTPPPLP